MRYAWIALVIILLDQSIKWAMHASDISGGVLIDAGAVSLVLLKSTWLSEGAIYTKLANSTTLVLLLSLLVLHLLVSRWSSQSYFITRKTKIGMQLASAGIFSYVADTILAGTIRSALRLDFAGAFAVNAGIADIALLLGFTLLMLALYQGGSKIQCKIALSPNDIAPLRFAHMPRGVDNVHIDVLLSPEFRKLSSRVIHTLVPIVIRHQIKGRQTINLPKNFLTEFTQLFNSLVDASLHMAKSRGDTQLPNLFYIAAQKQIHNEVANTVAAMIQHKKESVQERNRRGVGTRNDIHLIEWMFRHRERIVATSNLTLLNALGGGRNRAADKAIENILGKQNVFIQQARHAWLVKAESSADEFLLMNYYVTLGLQQEDKNSFLNIDKILSDTFRDFVPLLRTDTDREKSDKHLARESDTLSQPSVMMNSSNITVLLDTDWTTKNLRNHPILSDWKNHRKYRQHLDFQLF
jgi:lipoprotein signal peptidase